MSTLDRIAPDRKTFESIHRRLYETGTLRRNGGSGTPRTERTVELEEDDVLNIIEEDPGISLLASVDVFYWRLSTLKLTKQLSGSQCSQKMSGILDIAEAKVWVISYPGDLLFLPRATLLSQSCNGHLGLKETSGTQIPFWEAVKAIMVHSNKLPAQRSLSIIERSRDIISLMKNCLTEYGDALGHLAEQKEVTLVWVLGHSLIPGNEKANELARLGSVQDLDPDPICF
ncbi:hypothetical protein NQ317_002159 [Molorchus minor]|uniref:RNase H type-1 domain-containing protein n=1 Tax=Molorchus minor TaxID=1323400 RepID=A0ABQ9JKL6_9CUCU|nr:hypothetical protein NQ317_002159 [Molorchus minor]